jgi:hypothetical protein
MRSASNHVDGIAVIVGVHGEQLVAIHKRFVVLLGVDVVKDELLVGDDSKVAVGMSRGKLFDQLELFIGFCGVVDRRERMIFFRASRNHNVLAKLCLAGGSEERQEEQQARK